MLARAKPNPALQWMPIETGTAEFCVCPGDGTELMGWKSPCQVFAEPKARRRARASSRGGV